MKKAIAKRWIAALRSGKYKQGKGHLFNNGKYCCLGVLCDISKLDKWEHKDFGWYEYLGQDGVLPTKVRQWSGSKADIGQFHISSLAMLNDGGKRFSTIAKVIEKHWKEL